MLAHELLHLALRTHDRASGSGRLEFNYAHDYIINDILRVELGFASIPAGGLDMPGAREKSAEEIVLEMRRNAELMQSQHAGLGGQAGVGATACSGKAAQPATRQPTTTKPATCSPTRPNAKCFPADAAGSGDSAKPRSTNSPREGLALAKAMGAHEGPRHDGGALAAGRVMRAARALPPALAAGAAEMDRVGRAAASALSCVPRGAASNAATSCCRDASAQSWMLNVVLDTSRLDDRGNPARARRDRGFLRRRRRSTRSASCNATPRSPRTTVLSPDELAELPVSAASAAATFRPRCWRSPTIRGSPRPSSSPTATSPIPAERDALRRAVGAAAARHAFLRPMGASSPWMGAAMKVVQELVAYFDRRGQSVEDGSAASCSTRAISPRTRHRHMLELASRVGATLLFPRARRDRGPALGHRHLYRRLRAGGRRRPCRSGQARRDRVRQGDGGGAACRNIRARVRNGVTSHDFGRYGKAYRLSAI